MKLVHQPLDALAVALLEHPHEVLKRSHGVEILGLIRFGGHLPKGAYDVDHDGHAGQADAAELHG